MSTCILTLGVIGGVLIIFTVTVLFLRIIFNDDEVK